MHFQIFLEEWREDVVEPFLEFDEESFVFIAGFEYITNIDNYKLFGKRK